MLINLLDNVRRFRVSSFFLKTTNAYETMKKGNVKSRKSSIIKHKERVLKNKRKSLLVNLIRAKNVSEHYHDILI